MYGEWIDITLCWIHLEFDEFYHYPFWFVFSNRLFRIKLYYWNNSWSMVLCLVKLFLQCLSGKCMVFVNGNCQSFRTTKMYVIKEEGVSYFLYFVREVWLHWGDWLRVESRGIICCMLYINYEIFEQKIFFVFLR